MDTFLKVALGLVGVAAVAGVAYAVAKNSEENKQNCNSENENEHEDAVKEETLIEKVKTRAKKTTIKVFTWLCLHKTQIEAVAAVLGVVAAVLKVRSAAKDYATGSEIKETMDSVNKVMHDYTDTFNKNFQTIENDLGQVFDYMNEHDQMIFDALKKGA